MKRTALVVVLVLSATIYASAQTSTLKGLVSNGTTRKPAAGDEVILLRLDQGMQEEARTKTNGQGEFTFSLKDAVPRLVRVRGIAYDFEPMTTDRNFFAEDSHRRSSVQNNSPQRSRRLIPHEKDRILGVRQITNLVMQNTPAVRHAGARHDNFWRLSIIDCLGFFGGIRHGKLRKIKEVPVRST